MSDKKVMEEEEMTQKSGTRTNETTSNKEEQRSEFSNSHQQHPPISVSSRDKKDVEEEEEEEITQKSEFSDFQQNPPISSRDNSVGEEMAADSGSKDENEPDGNEDKSCDEEDDDTEGSAEEEEEEDDDDQREDEDRDESGSEDEAAINVVAEETAPDASDHDKGEKEVVEDGGGKHYDDNGDHLVDSNGQDCDDDDKSESKTSDSPRKKRNLELSKLANTWTGRIESPERAGRGKRSRKQPTLYDPQLVPARNWQSDELNQLEDMTSENSDVEEKKGNGETQTVKEDAAKNETRGEETEIVGDNFQRHGEPRCTFCGDDPAITICCFCACRKCFGKRDHDKLLLCDECDDEYHIYCLDPPLTEIPTMTKWYCPSCTSSQTKHATKVITQSPVKRKVGRPPASPKVGRPSSSSTTTTKAGSPTASRKLIREKGEKLDNQPRRRRGRPPKNTVGAASPRRATGRKRGRPPKKPSSPSPPAKRLKPPLRSPDGRFISPPPPSRTKTDPKPPSLHGAESKRLVASSSTKTIIVPVAVSSPTPVIVSRSGRTVKRSSFHDEIDEGEQHLKSSKQQVMVQVCKRASHMGTKKAATSERSGSGKRVVASVKTEELEDDKSGVEGMDVVAEPYDLTPSEQQQLASTDVVGKADMDVDVAPVARRTALSQVVPTTASSRESSKSLAMETAKAVSVSDEVANSASVDFGRRTTVSSGDPVGQPAVAYQNEPAPPSASTTQNEPETSKEVKVPRRKPGARECMQISRRFGCRVIPEKYIEILTDYCTRGKVEHLIRMRERLDEHSRYLESQLAGLLSLVKDKGDSDVVVPPLPEGPDRKLERTIAGDMFDN